MKKTILVCGTRKRLRGGEKKEQQLFLILIKIIK